MLQQSTISANNTRAARPKAASRLDIEATSLLTDGLSLVEALHKCTPANLSPLINEALEILKTRREFNIPDVSPPAFLKAHGYIEQTPGF